MRQLVVNHRLTLISASAGAGKTTLAADLVHSVDDVMVGWLSLDDTDNDIQQLVLAILLVILRSAEDDLIQMVTQGHISGHHAANARSELKL